jgi:hypothetical protein
MNMSKGNLRNTHNAHNGEQISLVSLSPNGTHIVTYSYNDNSIEVWNATGPKPILDTDIHKLSEKSGLIDDIKVNNDKIVCYVLGSEIKTFQMPKEPIELNLPPEVQRSGIIFKKNDDLVIFNNNKISVYSDKKNDELILKSSHELLSYNEVIERGSIAKVYIDEDENIWVISTNYLFHWDSKTYRMKFSYSLGFTADNIDEIDKRFTVMSKENSIVVKYNEKVAIFSKDVHFPIQIINLEDINIKMKLCEIENNVYLLAFNLPEKDYKQKINLYHITDINKKPIDVSEIFNKDNSKNEFILYEYNEYNSDLKKAFGLVNGKFSSINVDFDQKFYESHKTFFESHRNDDDFVGWNNYLYQGSYCNDTLAFPDMEKLRRLISDECKNIDKIKDINFKNQNYKWKIDLKNKKLSVYTDKKMDSKDLDNNSWNLKWNWIILNNNALALRYYGNCTGDTIMIYNYDINYNKIEFNYYYKKGFVRLNKNEFYGSKLPIASDITDLDKDILIKFINSIIEDDRCLVKYGPTLLPILIKSSDPKLTDCMEDIYNKCMKLVKEDPKRNLKFLNIITSSMNDLYKSHFDYITKFNSEMFMILDPSNERIDNKKDYPHFYTFSQEIEIIKTKYLIFFQSFQRLCSLYSFVMNILRRLIGRKGTQYITLVVPYIDYSCYPPEYSWLEIINPKPSVFVNTCEKEFYSNWNGEAIINFKWNTFGRTYYLFIWLIFTVFLICFTIASYPTNSLTQEIRIKLFQSSIAFGFFHLIFELRQLLFWKPTKYFLSIWNLFGKNIFEVYFKIY